MGSFSGGHIDSWDVGTGAMDDLSGVALNLATLSALKTLGKFHFTLIPFCISELNSII